MQRKGKLFITLKICFSFLLVSLTCHAYAEYYVVYPGAEMQCSSGCCECWRPCYHYLHFVSRHRHHEENTGQLEEYAWIGDP
jgi:hypothetical protein